MSQWHINKLNLQLPPELGPRADRIARQLGTQLAALSSRQSLSGGHLKHLDIPPINHSAGEPDHLLVRRIAEAIFTQLAQSTKGGGHGAD
ncbi:hypothetical protein P2G88_03715 [Aliiglaciecola sp. CAU 1673]|uniref:hypothetical protein n=1 Tax=Aliiglaciecola sp. CAU 1673 TaxID=3032595 RepID=UPI0023DCC45F|nr:hypothetical protein [Aliiglaciecola sp. CAU 1673]MDF2177351.1 hypothetical protein [Aliiglaciecola sp. CAU 1673]